MVTPVSIATGLGGAIGCSLRQSANQLVFVEFNGKVSAIDLVPSFSVVSSSPAAGAQLRGTWLFDLDTGVEGASGDIWWEQQTNVLRRMTPSGGAQIVNLGSVNFNAVSAAYLAGLTYGTTPIVGNNDATNQLVVGDVFAVRTNQGNYAKVKVLSYDYNLQIRWFTYRANPRYHVLGTGYTQPEDVAVDAAESHAYVTERSGNLLRVDLANANRAAATVVASGLTAPHQISLDEAHGYAYLVEFADPGRLLRIDLASGTATALVSDLANAIGLVMTSDRRFAFVTEQTPAGIGRLVRFDLLLGTRQELATSGTAPLFFLRWADAGEAAILTTERHPANQVLLMDLTQSPVAVTAVASGVPSNPSSVAVLSAADLLVCSDSVISELALTGSVYLPTGPILLGIGHVPVDRIMAGYADTTGDPGYFFQVKDAPFGGTLSVMLNHQRAYADGARWYKLEVDGNEPLQTFYDYRWNNALSQFELQPNSPSGGGFYPVRVPGQLWYTPWLGYRLDTSGLTNGLHTVAIRLFSAQSLAAEMGTAASPGRSVQLQIDNTWPTAGIDAILHVEGGGALVEVGTCAIVETATADFFFRVTASDGAEEHLMSWNLAALWGDNQSAGIASDSYSPVPSRKWAGITNTQVPAAAWTAIEHHCAHTFYLGVWDRVIDGYGHIHWSSYHKSITLLLP